MSTQVEVCNLALSHIGDANTISDITENSTQAGQCNRHWTNALNTALRLRDWSFARVSANLALKGTAPQGWTYQYATPVDMLIPRMLIANDVPLPFLTENNDGIRAVNDPYPYELGLNTADQSIILLTNLSEAILRYTAKNDIVSLWPVDFQTAMSYILAERIAMPLTRNPEIKDAMGQAARLAVSTASVNNLNSEEPARPADSGGIQARGQ